MIPFYVSPKTAQAIHDFLVMLLILLLALLISGCSMLAKGPVQEQAAKAVNKYCAEFSYSVRSDIIRPQFNALIAPNKARIDCLGDPANSGP